WGGFLPLSLGHGAALDERGPAPLLERHLDGIEVPGQDGLREDLASLTEELRAEVARRHVRERQQLDAGGACDLGGLARRRVAGLGGTVALFLAEGRLVDEQVGSREEQSDGLRRRSVAGVVHGASGPRGADELGRFDRPAAREGDRLTALERSPLRP